VPIVVMGGDNPTANGVGGPVTPANPGIVVPADVVTYSLHARERSSPHILTEWPNNPTDEATCVACDWKTICPAHYGQAPAVVPDEA
jgi:hypothetical protein